MPDGSTVVVLGAGVGGLVAARRLRKKLGAGHRVVVVEREEQLLFQPSLLWLLDGSRRAGQIRRPITELLPRGVELVRGEAGRIALDTRTVAVADQEVQFDHLLLATGAELAPERVPGLPDAGHNLYTAAGAGTFADALKGFTGGRIIILTAAPAYKCPAAPYEAAMLVEAACRRRGVRDRVTLDVIAAEPAPMPVAGPAVGEGVVRLLTQRGIGYTPSRQVERVEDGALVFADGTREQFDLLGFVPPHRVPRVIHESGLCPETGWVSVDPQTMATETPGAWAVGDVVSIPLQMGRPLPKAGVFAHAQAEVAASNIAAAIAGGAAPARFDGHGVCFVETGGGRAAYGGGNFYALPVPAVRLRSPMPWWHWARLALERRWLRRPPWNLLPGP